MGGYTKIKCVAIMLILIFPISFLINNNIQWRRKPSSSIVKPEIIHREYQRPYKIKPIDQKLVNNPPRTSTSKPEIYGIRGTTWTNPPGSWWDTDWEYRVNITVQEPNIADRNNWPIDVYLTFDPPAHKFSIRVYDTVVGLLLPYQITNITYADPDKNYISAATISFHVTLNKGAGRVYQIYWSTEEKTMPFYDKNILYTEDSTPNGPVYTIYRSDEF